MKWGRWRDAGRARSEFAEHVEAMEAERAKRQSPVVVSAGVVSPSLPQVSVDPAQLMNPVGALPAAPAEVEFQGRHLFAVLVAYEVDPYALAQAGGRVELDARTALDVSAPTCYWCGRGWSMRTGQQPCPGTER